MSSPPPPEPPQPPQPPRGKSRVIVGEKANRKEKPSTVHSQYGEIDLNSPLLKASAGRSGPSRSLFKWLGATIFIRLFRLSVKFIPIAGVLVGAVYSYTYFFGSIPILDAAKQQLGFKVVQQKSSEPRIAQMLGQTRAAVAKSDSRVNLGNALAAGNLATAEAIESGQMIAATPSSAPPLNLTVPSQPTTRTTTNSGLSVADKLDDMLASLNFAAEAPPPPPPAPPGETTTRQMTVGGKETSQAETPATPRREITIVQDSRMAVRSPFHDVDYRRGPGPSAAFRQWAQSISISKVEPDYKPRVTINNMTFVSGNMVDFALGVSLAGIAEDGALVVFRNDNGAHVTVRH